jgi:hypothetical protein
MLSTMISQESTEKGRHRITLAALSERLKIPLRTLFRYRRDHPEQAPKSFDDLEAWVEFVGKIKNYSAERTRPLDQNETESSAEDQNGEYSAAVERRERILKLRLINAAKRAVLERRIRSTVTMVECEAAMERIRAAVSGEVLKLPASLCDQLAGRNPQHIQEMLNVALRSSLERLSLAKTYLSAQSC